MIGRGAMSSTRNVALDARHLLSALPGFALVLICCTPRLQVHIRKRLRPYLLQTIAPQHNWISWAQKYSSQLVSLAVDLSALSVSVEFYVLLLPLFQWFGYQKLGALLVFGLALCLYVTCALKDLLCSPRPLNMGWAAVRAGVRLHEDVEYGAPSLHVSMTVCLCWYTLHKLSEQGVVTADWHPFLYFLTMCWVVWIAWTRLYLGVHYPADLVLGTIVGSSVVGLWTIVDEWYLEWVQFSTYAPAVQLVLSFVLLHNYPRPEGFTVSYVHATTFVGAWFGGVLMNSRQLSGHPVITELQRIGSESTAPFAVRVLCGYVLLALAKLVSKACLLYLLPFLFAALPPKLRTVLQPPIACMGFKGQEVVSVLTREDGTAWDIDTTARFLSYASVSMMVVLVSKVLQVDT